MGFSEERHFIAVLVLYLLESPAERLLGVPVSLASAEL